MVRMIARIFKMVLRQGFQLDRIERRLQRMEATLNEIHTQVIEDDAVSLGLEVGTPTEQITPKGE